MIKIICVGRLKEKFLKDACDEYIKRLGKYTKIEVIEVMDSNIDEDIVALEKEKDLILKNIKERDYIVTLEIEGQNLTSVEFSKK